MTAVFVTSTGTDLGKTFVVRGLIKQLRARGRTVEALKPVITGFDPRTAHASDTGRLLAARGRPLTPSSTSPKCRPTGCANRCRLISRPAARATRVDFEALNAFCRSAVVRHKDALVIEGIGGIMVPLDERHTVLDWMIEIDLPVILVTGSYVIS